VHRRADLVVTISGSLAIDENRNPSQSTVIRGNIPELLSQAAVATCSA
jgi:hypothetical protein